MTLLHNLPADLSNTVKTETAGERIRWIGRPSPGRIFISALPIWLMGIPWSALSWTIFGALTLSVLAGKPTTRVVSTGETWVMGVGIIFTGSFALIGLGMMVAPVWAAWKARRTAHVITDKRLLTVTVGHGAKITSVLPHQMLRFTRHQRADGSGTLTIVTSYGKDSDGDRVTNSEMLVGVPQAAQAERLLRDMTA